MDRRRPARVSGRTCRLARVLGALRRRRLRRLDGRPTRRRRGGRGAGQRELGCGPAPPQRQAADEEESAPDRRANHEGLVEGPAAKGKGACSPRQPARTARQKSGDFRALRPEIAEPIYARERRVRRLRNAPASPRIALGKRGSEQTTPAASGRSQSFSWSGRSGAGRSRERRWKEYGESNRHRPRHDQLVRRGHGGVDPQGHREFRGRPHDALDRRVHRRRRAARRPAGQAPGGDQPRAHLLRDQAPHRPVVRRPDDQEGHGPRPVQDRARAQRRRLGDRRRQAVFALADLGLRPAEDEGDRRGPSRRAGHAGGHHRSRLLQRRPAAGDQGRRQDRRPRGPAHHQRADRGGARLRPRQEEGRHDRGLRPRRRHLRHLDPRDRRRRVRGEVDQRRHVPRRRGLRHAPRRISGRRVQEGAGHRPDQGQARAAAPEGGGGEGQDRALLGDPDRHQPALHHRRRDRARSISR